MEQDSYILNTFDDFIKTLRRYASWTSGVGIWKDDYEKIPKNRKVDRISPHSGILFSERKKNCYLIDNFVFSREITSDHTKKGVYDGFKAFAIEEFAITLNLFIDGDISIDTLKYVKKDYKQFVSELYWRFCIIKRPCSYDLTGFEDAMGIFFKKRDIIVNACFIGLKKFLGKIKNIVLIRK